jgi:hypothetical protein
MVHAFPQASSATASRAFPLERMETTMTNEEIGHELRAQRRLLEALVAALAPDEAPAEKSLIEALAELTQIVDEQTGAVSSMHSHVFSRLAPSRPVSEPA